MFVQHTGKPGSHAATAEFTAADESAADETAATRDGGKTAETARDEAAGGRVRQTSGSDSSCECLDCNGNCT